ncbi:MAG: helix-hairpin-helix domain-containing protein, partial [Planctomycetota bacterium]
MENDKIAATLEQLADLMEFTGANAFRLRAYRNGARVIRAKRRSVRQRSRRAAGIRQGRWPY